MVIIVVVIIALNADMRRRYHIGAVERNPVPSGA
jgi:hypothetical protein